ncbi:MAG: phosphatase PAP2 family protein [Bacteroidota bacterium]
MKSITTLLFLFITTTAFCQQSTFPSAGEFSIKNSFSSFFKEEKTIWSYPVKLKKTDLNYILPSAALIGMTYTFDQPIQRELAYLNNHNTDVNSFNKSVTYLGDGAINMSVSSLFVLHGLLFNNHRSIETGYLSAKAMVHAGIVVFVLKTMAGRERPLTKEQQGSFHFFEKMDAGSGYHSFPSGHTITAFSMATVIAKEYADKKWVGGTAYGLATLVGFSRIGLSKHWASDVFTGALLGYAIGNFTYNSHQQKWHIFPSVSTKNASVNFIKQF